MTPVSTRLVRLLNMVPYFQVNQRITFAEASADLGVSRRQLEADLNQLWMCGLPGYGPGDLIDIEFSGDTIEVVFSAGMDRPLRLTSPEATGLLSRCARWWTCPVWWTPKPHAARSRKSNRRPGPSRMGRIPPNRSRHPPKAALPRRSGRPSGTVAH